MFAVIGWLSLAALLMAASGVALAASFNNLGRYNIGGVPNSAGIKLGTMAFVAFVAWLWWLLAQAAPFAVALK